MNVIVFGASGMVGQGVLRECLLAPDVGSVLAIGRSELPLRHPKLRQLVRADLFHYRDVADQLAGYDACFFCVGVSASDTDEAGFVRLNYDLPLAAAHALVERNPGMTFVYVSGGGTDSTEKGPAMWARVKGRTENALQRLGFRAVYLFRPGIIVPLNGERSKTRLYRLFYAGLGWAIAPLRRLFPNEILDTERVGRAMLQAVRNGGGPAIVERADINRLAQAAAPGARP
ncbi:NAD-dependent epimerase/dehydratase family protein [Burkholderia sp. Bp9002]|nr:NAD-dependent epimerase/dehydratase family protein [Burkholderia sp. Bp9002]